MSKGVKRFYTFTAMDIKPDLVYSVKEASELLNLHPRKLTRLAVKKGIEKTDNRYLFTGQFLIDYYDLTNVKRVSKDVKQETSTILGKPLQPFKTTNKTDIQESRHDIQESQEKLAHQEKLQRAIELITIESLKQNVQHKIFTALEYDDIIATRDRVEHQQEQIQYLRKRVERQDEILTNLFKNIERRDYIEAKDKGHDKET